MNPKSIHPDLAGLSLPALVDPKPLIRVFPDVPFHNFFETLGILPRSASKFPDPLAGAPFRNHDIAVDGPYIFGHDLEVVQGNEPMPRLRFRLTPDSAALLYLPFCDLLNRI
jgi:hypothetical protein